jgi:hypothetical protein
VGRKSEPDVGTEELQGRVDGVLVLLPGGEEPTGGHSDGDRLEVLDHVPLPLVHNEGRTREEELTGGFMRTSPGSRVTTIFGAY